LENRLLWKTIVIQKGLFELSAFWKLGGLWRAFLCFWRHLTVKGLLHLDFFLVQQPLLPYFDFDMDKCREYVALRNPNARVIPICARTGEGIDEWADWLKEQVRAWQR